ncbi:MULTISPECIES: hypothetical protein [Giesbergeria]|uniref:Uncharacterized protein n=1 Tax=Giesbergeria sinuosa TaxID=80883 RepID=A0ABV9QBA1_9BURK
MAFYVDPTAINRGTSMYEHAIARNRQEEIDAREQTRFNDEQQRNRALDTALGQMPRADLSAGADVGGMTSYLQRLSSQESKPPAPPADMGGMAALTGQGNASAESAVETNLISEPQANPATNNIPTKPLGQQTQGNVGGAASHPAIAPIEKRFQRESKRLQALMDAATAKRDIVAASGLGAQLDALNSDFATAKMVGVTMHELQNNPQMGTALAKRLTENNSYGELVADFDPKYGMTTLKIKDTGREVRLAPHQLGVMVAALQDMENGNYERGYKNLTLIDKEVAERIQRGNELQKSVVANNNDAAAKNEAIRHARVSDGRAATDQSLRRQEFDAKKPVYDVAALDASISIEMAKHDPDSPEYKALQTRRNALRDAKNSSPELKHAQELVRAGVVPDLKSGLEMATTRKSKSAQDVFLQVKGMKRPDGLSPSDEEVDKNMRLLVGDNWMDKVRGGAASAPGAAPTPASGGKPSTGKPIPNTIGQPLKDVTPQDIANTAKRHGVSEEVVKRRLGM